MTGVRDLRVIVVGAGMAGILSAIKLREAGLTDLVVYEKADRLGGTWRENTYPGIACDVPSHLYSYSFALNPDWSQSFSPGEEILDYFERVARDHGVIDDIRFGEEVTGCEWVDGRWHLETAAGTQLTLENGGARLEVNGVLDVERPPHEYEDIYARFAELLRDRRSLVDAAPLRLVADAFLVGRRVVTDPFLD